jgi:hypothetical protein
MSNPSIAESLVGLFVAMTLVVTFRRRTSRAIELAVWIGLVWVCIVAVARAGDPQARALTAAAAWGAAQVIGMVLDLAGQDVLRWMYLNRFLIADWVVLAVGVDVLLLALVAARRQADAGTPVTKLREWWVLPRLRATQPEPAPVYGVEKLNQRFSAWWGPAAAATAMAATLFAIWWRDVEIPRVARALRRLTSPDAEERTIVAESPSLDPDIVDIAALAESAAARKVESDSPRRTPRSNKNVSKKHREGRLAS